MTAIETLATLVASALTMMILSYVYKENKFYQFAEHTFIGVATGYSAAVGFGTIQSSGIEPLLNGKILVIIPIILGLMLLSRFSSQYRHLSLIPTAILSGVGLGLGVRGSIKTSLLDQISATILPLFNPENLGTSINNILLLLMVSGTLVYFVFTKEHTGPTGGVAWIGRLTIMIALGSSFGNTVMTRMTLLLGRVQFVLEPPAIYLLPIAIVAIAADIYLRKNKNETPEI